MSPIVSTTKRLLAIPLVLLLGSCGDSKVWSIECRSANAAWVAAAYTVERGGFGTGAVETIVEIRRASGSGTAERVLAFADDGSALHLRMNWDSPTHLSVVYDSDPELLYYQVVKTSGVEISVRDLATVPSQIPTISAQP